MIKKWLAKLAMLALVFALAVCVGCAPQGETPSTGGTSNSDTQQGETGGNTGESGSQSGSNPNGGYWTGEVPLS